MKKLTNVSPLLVVPLLIIICVFLTMHVVHAQSGHGIKLTWTQSTSPGLTANTVYRSTVSGGPYTQIWTGAPTTSYNDPMTNSNQGTKACYVVTATAAPQLESPFSNETCNTFPSQTQAPSGVTSNTY